MDLRAIAVGLAIVAGKRIHRKTREYLHPEEKEKRERDEYLIKAQEEAKRKKQREKTIQNEKAWKTYQASFWVILFVFFMYINLSSINNIFPESLWKLDAPEKYYAYERDSLNPISFWLNILFLFITYKIFRKMIKSVSGLWIDK